MLAFGDLSRNRAVRSIVHRSEAPLLQSSHVCLDNSTIRPIATKGPSKIAPALTRAVRRNNINIAEPAVTQASRTGRRSVMVGRPGLITSHTHTTPSTRNALGHAGDVAPDAVSRAPNEAHRTGRSSSRRIQRAGSPTPKRGDGFSSSTDPAALIVARDT